MSSEHPSREALIAAAGESIARGSRSFALASRLFDRRTREHAWLLYAWCRACDDLADGQDHGGHLSKATDPEAIVRLTDRALAGEWVGQAPFDGLRLLCAEVPVPIAMIHDHIAGFALDADGWRPETQADLIRYCHHVAGIVGQMMAIVMGISPNDRDTLDRAEHLGLAFQLANIARDVREDAEAGRCYLPAAWLAELGLKSDALLAKESRDQVALLTHRLANLAEEYERSARIGARRLPFRARWAVLAAAGIYGGIARKVAQRGARALDRRVVTSGTAKLGAVLQALLLANLRPSSRTK
jgi:15-cis-phytoene synthase